MYVLNSIYCGKKACIYTCVPLHKSQYYNKCLQAYYHLIMYVATDVDAPQDLKNTNAYNK